MEEVQDNNTVPWVTIPCRTRAMMMALVKFSRHSLSAVLHKCWMELSHEGATRKEMSETSNAVPKDLITFINCSVKKRNVQHRDVNEGNYLLSLYSGWLYPTCQESAGFSYSWQHVCAEN